MKRNAWIAAIAAAVFSTAALAHGPGGGGFGPGMGGGFKGGPGGGCGMGAETLDSLGLTAEQRQQIATIMDESSAKRLALMNQMHDARSQAVRTGKPDVAAMTEVRSQMFALSTESRQRIDAVLTPEQRERLGSGWRGMGPGR